MVSSEAYEATPTRTEYLFSLLWAYESLTVGCAQVTCLCDPVVNDNAGDLENGGFRDCEDVAAAERSRASISLRNISFTVSRFHSSSFSSLLTRRRSSDGNQWVTRVLHMSWPQHPRPLTFDSTASKSCLSPFRLCIDVMGSRRSSMSMCRLMIDCFFPNLLFNRATASS